MNDRKIINLDWQDIETACLDVSRKIKASGFDADIVLPVLWGGIVPARIIMDILDINRVDCKPIHARSYKDCKSQTDIDIEIHIPKDNYTNCKALIIEEIVDSGRTVKTIMDHLEEYRFMRKNIAVATLVWRNKSNNMVPDFYHMIIDKEWIIYPWDKNEYIRSLKCLQ